MKTNLKSNSILLGGLLLLGTVFSCTQAEQDYASYVNPFIGTGGHGHTYPGAVVPNGMILKLLYLSVTAAKAVSGCIRNYF